MEEASDLSFDRLLMMISIVLFTFCVVYMYVLFNFLLFNFFVVYFNMLFTVVRCLF